MTSWPRVPVSDLCSLIVDCVNKTAPSVDQETPYKMIRTTNIKNGQIDLKGCRSVSIETFEKWTKRAKVLRGDILLTREAPMGEVGRVNFDESVFLGQRVVQYRVNPKKLTSEYLLYSFLSPDLQYQFRRHDSSGSTVSHIRVPDCLKFEIPLPALGEQKKIAAVLSALDAKIDCNNRTNAELEAMAKTLYDYWFVQFDFPDANGKPYKSSGGEMFYNPSLKREIPVGWADGSLWEIARYFNGLPMQKHRPTGSEYLPVIKIKEMGAGLSNGTEKAGLNIPRDAIVDDGDVLFSWSATLDVKIWAQGRGALNQHIFKVTSSKYPKTFYYFELLAYLDHFKMMAEKRKTTMGHITQDHLKQSKICIPPLQLLSWGHIQIEPLLKKHLTHEKENQHLTQLRDWLLPFLMNGQVTVA